MRLFLFLMLKLQRAGRLAPRQVREMLRTMRAFSHAWDSGQPLPAPARWITRPGLPLLLWSAWRVSHESPSLFMFGVLAMPPAIVMLFVTVGRWIWRGLRPLLGMGA